MTLLYCPECATFVEHYPDPTSEAHCPCNGGPCDCLCHAPADVIGASA